MRALLPSVLATLKHSISCITATCGCSRRICITSSSRLLPNEYRGITFTATLQLRLSCSESRRAMKTAPKVPDPSQPLTLYVALPGGQVSMDIVKTRGQVGKSAGGGYYTEFADSKSSL